MWFTRLVRSLKPGSKSRRFDQPRKNQKSRRTRPQLEALEDRSLPSTFTVTTTADGGPSSLRQAILDANASPGPNTINMPAGFYQLTQGELSITNDVTITGDNKAGTVIDGASQSRIFDVFGVNASFSWLTIQNGLAQHGAGILNDGGALSVSHCTVGGAHRNFAESNTNGSDAAGGGIYSAGGSVAISDSVFGNRAQPNLGSSASSANAEGADIHATNCQVSIARSAFNGFTFARASVNTQGGNAEGGSIYVANSSLAIANCSLSGLVDGGFGPPAFGGGDGQGGTIYATGSTITASESQIYGTAVGGFSNSFNGSTQTFGKDGDTQGGAIYLVNSSFMLSNSLLTGSSNGGDGSGLGDNAYGGGIFASNSSVTVVKSNLSGCGAFSDGPLNGVGGNAQGGAIYADGTSTVTVNNSVLSSDSVISAIAGIGGAIYNAGVLTINHSRVSGSATIGGALANYGSATLRNSIVSPIANFGTLTDLSSSAGLTTATAGGTGSDPGALLGGDIDLYVNNSNGDLTADELARIQDAVSAVDAVTEPFGVAVREVSAPTLADVTLNMDTTSAVGGYAAGVLGCTTDAGQITIIAGWIFYAGSDPSAIAAGQYDFQTVVTHELGHALGLGHSANAASVMYATLTTGTTNRALAVADLNVPDSCTGGACGLHAALNSNFQEPSSKNQTTDFTGYTEIASVSFLSVASVSSVVKTFGQDTTVSQDWNPDPHAALTAVLADWSPTTDFAGQVASILDDRQNNGLLHGVGMPGIDVKDDFWSSIGGITTPDKVGNLTMELGGNPGRG